MSLSFIFQKLEDVASELLGQTTFVGWPHLHEAKVYAVANENYKSVTFTIESSHSFKS